MVLVEDGVDEDGFECDILLDGERGLVTLAGDLRVGDVVATPRLDTDCCVLVSFRFFDFAV